MGKYMNDSTDLKGEFDKQNDNRLMIFVLLILALFLIVYGLWFYRQQSQTIRMDKINELNSIAELKVNEIMQWRKDRLADIRNFSDNPFINDAFNQWLTTPDNDAAGNTILQSFQLLKDSYQYRNIILVDKTGSVSLSLDPRFSALDEYTSNLASRAIQKNELFIGDFYRDTESGQVNLDIFAAIQDKQNQPVGVLILRVDPEVYLYPLIQSWPTPSLTAETLLFRRDGEDVLFLNLLRHSTAEPLTLKIPLNETDVPAVQGVLGYTGEFEGIDYRGEPVVAEIYPIPGSPWYMIAKVNSKEILSDIRDLLFRVIFQDILALILILALFAYFYRDRQRQLFEKLYEKERQLTESQKEAQITLYSIGDAVISTDSLGNVNRLNPVAEQLTGWTEAEAKGMSLEKVFNIINEQTRLKVENPVNQVLREGVVIGLANHTLLKSKDGTERPIADSGAPIKDIEGNISGVVLVFRDQTRERAVQNELALLSDTIRASQNEIYIFDEKNYRFKFINEGALRNLGYTLDQMKSNDSTGY